MINIFKRDNKKDNRVKIEPPLFYHPEHSLWYSISILDTISYPSGQKITLPLVTFYTSSDIYTCKFAFSFPLDKMGMDEQAIGLKEYLKRKYDFVI